MWTEQLTDGRKTLIISKEYDSSSEASSSSATREIPHSLHNPEFHFPFSKQPPRAPVLWQRNPVQNLSSYILIIQFNIILPSTPRFFKWYFRQISQPKPYITFFPLACIPHAPPIQIILNKQQPICYGTRPYGQVSPFTGHEGPQGEQRYSSTLFQTSALEGGEGSASRPGSTLPPGKTRYPLYRRLGGPQGRSGQVRKISPHRDLIPGPSSPQAVAIPTTLPGSRIKFYNNIISVKLTL